MLIELWGGPADGLVLDSVEEPPASFVLPDLMFGIGYLYVCENTQEDGIREFRFKENCSIPVKCQ